MIGNDIVSLEVARTTHRSGDARFLSRICSANEQTLLSGQDDRERALWTLWALKESTYKLEYRLWRHRRFAPKRYICQSWMAGKTGLPEQACLETPQGRYVGRIIQHGEYVHALVAQTPALLDQLSCAAVRLPSTPPRLQSLALRAAAQQALRVAKQSVTVRISPAGQEDIPQVWLQGDQPGPMLSLSHHGAWGAYVFVASRTPDFAAL